MIEYQPNETIIDKACSLWVSMLSDPKFDALGKNKDRDDPNGSMFLAQSLVKMNALGHKASSECLEKFSTVLKKYLMNKTTYDREQKKMIFSDKGSYELYLSTDYHPDIVLSQVAEESSISKELFPWKTNMNIDQNYLSLRYGYGAETLYYYPVDGKWLITTLHGSDIEKVIQYVKGGKPEFVLSL